MITDTQKLATVGGFVLTLTRTEDELRAWICQELGCPAATPTTPPATQPTPAALAVFHGTILNDGFYFDIPLGGPDTETSVRCQLDTGAFEMLLTAAIAEALHLPNLGAVDISGVTGSATAYNSEVTVVVGDNRYTGVHCVVDPSFTGNPLFGLRFFLDHRIALALNPVTATLTLTAAG
jgi:hypothetical protein